MNIIAGLFFLCAGLFFLHVPSPYVELIAGICGVILGVVNLAGALRHKGES